MADFGSTLFGDTLESPLLPLISGVDFTFYRASQALGAPGIAVLVPLVNAAFAAGIRPVVKISVSFVDATNLPPTTPAELLAYGNYVTALATPLVGKVGAYAIQNELDMPYNSSWTGANYATARAVAYARIKLVDPTAIVLDSAITELGYANYYVQQRVTGGDAPGALDWLRQWSLHWRVPGFVVPHTLNQLTAWLALPENVRKRGLVTDLLGGMDYDAIQVHYLTDAWEYIPEFMLRLQGWFPGVDLHVWESWYGWDEEAGGDISTWDEDNHAAGLMRTMIGLAGMGAVEVGQLPHRDYQAIAYTVYPWRYNRGLVDLAYDEHYAAFAYETMAAKIGGIAGTALAWGTGVHAYRFGTVYAAWAENPTIVDVNFADEALLTNIYGDTRVVSSAAVPLGQIPTYIESYDAPIRDGWIKRQ